MTRQKARHTATWLTCAACAILMAPATQAAAEDFPVHPIKFIVPFPPGSGTDTSARYFGKKLTELTGQSVIVENRPGGNGFIAVQTVLAAPPDGYTVFVGSNSTLAVNVAVFNKLPYNPQSDLAPLSMMMRAPAVIAVPASSPYKSVSELVQGAKAQPGKLNFAGGSAGYQLMGELFNDMAGVNTMHVPYKGASEALTAVASGMVDVTFADITAAEGLVRSGKVRALAVASDHRAKALPDVVTTKEAGLPGYEAYVWVGAMVPAKTPKPVADKLATLLTKIERMPETQDFYQQRGAETMQGGPEEMRKFQGDEIEQWKRIAAKANIERQ